MRVRQSSAEVEIEAEDIVAAITKNCPNSTWGGCECGGCVDGLVLNEEGIRLKKLLFKV